MPSPPLTRPITFLLQEYVAEVLDFHVVTDPTYKGNISMYIRDLIYQDLIKRNLLNKEMLLDLA